MQVGVIIISPLVSPRHCEPVRTLVWQSPYPLQRRAGDEARLHFCFAKICRLPKCFPLLGGAGDEARLHFSLQGKEKLLFGSVKPSPPTVHRTVGTDFRVLVTCEIKRKSRCVSICFSFYGAGDEARTRYLHLGKVALYRMSYTRKWRPRTDSNRRPPA